MPLPKKPPRTFLTDLALLQQEVNRLFERLAEFERTDHPAAGGWCPSVDVYECRGKLMVVAEVPGLAPDSLKVVCRDHALVVSGERRERRPAAGTAAYLCMERAHGRFSRTIPLDGAVDLCQAEARLMGGLLTIAIPRLKDRRGRETVVRVVREEE